MKKKLSYRDQLIELAQIYDVKEIKDYVRNRKNLTTGQLELILKKNKIVIPKEFKTNFFKENFIKPLSKASKRIEDFKEGSSRKASKVSRQIGYFKEDSSRNFSRLISNLWRSMGSAGLGFLNIFPKVGKVIYNFFGDALTNLFHGIYDQQINKNKSGKIIVAFFLIAGVITVVISGVNTFYKSDKSLEKQIVKKEIKEPKIKDKKEIQKPKTKVKKEVKKPEVKVKNKEKKEKVTELILPDLNLKTSTVLSLFEDVEYDLNTVRYQKKVKPIYFTQFPKDL